jgi:hypothetical protein
MMRWLLRPSLVTALSAAVVVGAFLIIWATGLFPGRGGDLLAPLPVAREDREIVWLYAATNPTAWERFVAGVRRSAERLRAAHPGLEAQIGPDAFPRHTTATPQVALAIPGTGRRLVFRWYKLTSDLKTRDWIEALLHRDPPPLAIIGGSSSDGAIELAAHLQQAGAALPEARRPLLLLTTATADRVQTHPAEVAGRRWPSKGGEDSEETLGIGLGDLYPGRTFRFCFSNRQMAAAVTRFVWTQDDLRPDGDPVYMAQWLDDSYSPDLTEGFWQALRAQVAESAVRDWSWVTGCVGAGGSHLGVGGGIFPVHRAGPEASSFSMAILPTPHPIDSSVGSFAGPNRFESKAARHLIDLLLEYERTAHKPGALATGTHNSQQRPLLVLTGQAQPSRRFLRALEGYGPQAARRFVVATGDAIAFNTIYRDRLPAWPIQDLPFPLVFFCHHNPTDRTAGFRPEAESAAAPANGGVAATGTEDVLLYEDIIDALIQADATSAADAADLGRRMRDTRLGPDGRVGPGREGVPLFDAIGNRRSGTGEHVVCLRPCLRRVERGKGETATEVVLPEATIEVWAWRPLAGPETGGHVWQHVGEPLRVNYDDVPGDGGEVHVGK